MLLDIYEMEERSHEMQREAAHLRLLREVRLGETRRNRLASTLANLGNQMISFGEWLQERYGECKEAAFELSMENSRQRSM